MKKQKTILSFCLLMLLNCAASFAQTEKMFKQQELKGVWKNELPNGIMAMDISHNGTRIVTGGLSNELVVWEAKTGTKLMELKGHTDNIVAVRFSPNGRFIASGGVDNTVILWDAITGDVIRKYKEHKDYVHDLAFSPDSKHIASASWDGTTIIWDAVTGVEIGKMEPHKDNVTAVDFSFDGTEMLTASGDHTVAVWDTKTWKKKYDYKIHTDEVWDARFSSNGRFIVSGGWDNMCRVYDVEKRVQTHQINAHVSDVWSVAFTPDQQLIVTGGGDNFVRVWDAATGELVAESSNLMHNGSVESVAVTKDGKFIVSADRNGGLMMWNVPILEDRVAAHVNKKYKEWAVKSKYEKQEDYEQRLTRRGAFETEWKSEFNQIAVNNFFNTVYWADDIKIVSYDAERGQFEMFSKYLGTLYAKVPNRDAEQFETKFDQVVFADPDIILGEKGYLLRQAVIKPEYDSRKGIYILFSDYDKKTSNLFGK